MRHQFNVKNMPSRENVRSCYDKTASAYADKFFHELENKHLDRILLQSFSVENKHKGKMIDMGCGPGQTTNLLSSYGVSNLIGIDVSEEMINKAKQLNSKLEFEIADILQLKYPDEAFGSAVAFYAIVHFDEDELRIAFEEIKRVLLPNGHFLFSFHVGDEVVNQDTFLNEPVNIDFYFWETNTLIKIAKEAGFHVVDIIERQPYPDIEYPSVRAYAWLRKS